MNSRELKRAKRRIRQEVRADRDALEASERERASVSIAERVLALPEVEDATAVMAFWSFGSEVGTAPLIAGLHARGVRVALPRIVDGDLVPVTYVPGDPVTTTAFGACEPSAGRTLDPAMPTSCVYPDAARQGSRLFCSTLDWMLALAIYEQALGPQHPKTLDIENNFGMALRSLGRFEGESDRLLVRFDHFASFWPSARMIRTA